MSGDGLPFAGELLRNLALEGRLVIDRVRADEVICGLERTLAQVRSRMQVIQLWQQIPARRFAELPDALAQHVVDAVFVDQLAPGQLEQAAVELPKYIEAIRLASATPPAAE